MPPAETHEAQSLAFADGDTLTSYDFEVDSMVTSWER